MSRPFAVSIATLALLAAGPGPAAAQDSTHRIEMMSSLLGGSYLGVVIDDVGAESASELKLQQPRGAAVREVEQDSPAAAAGLLAGDVIVAFDGESVRSVAHLTRLVRETPAERVVGLEVWREGASRTLEATLKKRDHLAAAGDLFSMPHMAGPGGRQGGPFAFQWHSEDGDDAGEDRKIVRRLRYTDRPLKLGLSYQPLSEQLAEHFGVGGGVLVSEVHEDSPAERAGLKAGDVIVRFDGQQIDGQRSFARAVRKAEPGDEVVLTVSRGGQEQELQLAVGGAKQKPHDEALEPASQT